MGQGYRPLARFGIVFVFGIGGCAHLVNGLVSRVMSPEEMLWLFIY